MSDNDNDNFGCDWEGGSVTRCARSFVHHVTLEELALHAIYVYVPGLHVFKPTKP